MIWVDQLVAEAQSEQVTAAILKASGRFKNSDGSDVEIPNPVKVKADFDAALERPLDHEQQRARILAAIRTA